MLDRQLTTAPLTPLKTLARDNLSASTKRKYENLFLLLPTPDFRLPIFYIGLFKTIFGEKHE